MIVRRSVASIALTLALTFSSGASCAELTKDEAYTIARDAYIYAYPFMIEYVTVRQAGNYAEPTGIVAQAPVNQFSHARDGVGLGPADVIQSPRQHYEGGRRTATPSALAVPMLMAKSRVWGLGPVTHVDELTKSSSGVETMQSVGDVVAPDFIHARDDIRH